MTRSCSCYQRLASSFWLLPASTYGHFLERRRGLTTRNRLAATLFFLQMKSFFCPSLVFSEDWLNSARRI